MGVFWGRALDEPGSYSKRDAAETAGFDPADDRGSQPAYTTAEWDALPLSHPSKLRVTRWVHQGSRDGCELCGERCDRCGDRMCSQWGPEPRACGVTCVDCGCDCPTCFMAREEMRADLLHRIEREGR
jgi:hypothetical protein